MQKNIVRRWCDPHIDDGLANALYSYSPSLRLRFVPCFGKKRVDGEVIHDEDGCKRSFITNQLLCNHWVLERRVRRDVWGGLEWRDYRPQWVLEKVIKNDNGGYRLPDMRLMSELYENDLWRKFSNSQQAFYGERNRADDVKQKREREGDYQWDYIFDRIDAIEVPMPGRAMPGSEIRGREL